MKDLHRILLEKIDERAFKVIDILNENLFEAFVVGGCVRDAILGLQPKDIDICTNAPLDKILLIFPEAKVVGESFQVAKVKFEGLEIDIARFRKELNCDGRHCECDFEATLIDDLSRRDLSINAIAFNGRDLIDLFHASEDLSNGVIRFIGNPIDRINEDNLRILRAIRIGMQKFGKLDFDKKTKFAIIENMHKIKTLSKERVTEELLKILKSFNFECEESKETLRDVLTTVFGIDFARIINFNQNSKWHNMTLDNHTFKVLDEINKTKWKDDETHSIMAMSAILHDLGKISVAKLNEKTGFTNFIFHERESAVIAERLMGEHLKLSNKISKNVTLIIKNHMAISLDSKIEHVNKLMIISNMPKEQILFHRCDKLGKKLSSEEISIIEQNIEQLISFLERLEQSSETIINRKQLAIDSVTIIEESKKFNIQIDKMSKLFDFILFSVIKNPFKNNNEKFIKMQIKHFSEKLDKRQKI